MKQGTGRYYAKIRRVIDGDSVVCDIDLGFGVWLHEAHMRLAGIDAPEIRTRDKAEKARGQAAKNRLQQMLKRGETYTLLTVLDKQKGKFGRILSDFEITLPGRGKTTVCKQLIKEKLVRKYDGGKRKSWAQTESARK